MVFFKYMADNVIITKIHDGGRLVIPARYRKELGLKPGDEVHVTLEDGEIRVISTRLAIAKAQALLRRYIPEGRDLSGELIRERRKEAYRE
jgi:AbrB family looped-hinge helix DNA binding protein